MDETKEKEPKNVEDNADEECVSVDISDLPHPTVIRRPKTPELDDPVLAQRQSEKTAKKKKPHPPCENPCVPCTGSIISTKIEPTISHRLGFKYANTGLTENEPRPRVYVSPIKLKKKSPDKDPTSKYHCTFDTTTLPKPLTKKKIDIKLEVPSPEPSSAKVAVRKATPSPSTEPFSPDEPDEEQLKLKKPKSGIFINVKEEKQTRVQDYDSFDLVYQRKPRPDNICLKRRKKRGKQRSGLDDITEDDEGERTLKRKKKLKKKTMKEDILMTDDEIEFLEARAMKDYYEEEGEDGDIYLTKMFRKKVSLMSAATSYQSKDIPQSTVSLFTEIGVDKYIQKFRRDSEIKRFQPKKKKIKRGTLQSHSFTNMYQPILKDFFFGSRQGTMHQGDESFPESIRNKQGICMSVAAYCYSVLSHPNKWTRENIDEILTWGNNLYMDTVKQSHFHAFEGELERHQLLKYCTIGCKKLRFTVEDPDVSGYIRSDDRRVYNLTKALNIFFARQTAGIFKTQDISLAIWKNKYLYMFDARPRTKDLYVSCAGSAIMANFYDVASLATIFLSRSNFCNWPFVIYPIKVYKIMHAEDSEEESNEELDVMSEYNILSENKAVVLGSFDLADKCFDFSRGKQSLTMAVIALVYSRITPPSAWHRKTIDKIMILGNLLYKECVDCRAEVDLKLYNLPAIFTIGPYIVEIYVFGNVFADVIYRSCVCQLKSYLESFFETCTNGILQIGRCHMAVWKQRNMLYCFDPYSRNNEGLAVPHGVACVSMHANLTSVVDTLARNFEKDSIFYLHALKVCKIHRDPCQSGRFPKHLSMDDFPVDTFKRYKMKKSKKNATEKPVTVDYSAIAMRRLLAGESPQASIYEIGSNVGSIGVDQFQPYFFKKCRSKPFLIEKKPILDDVIADLDRPSLSDTQIEPPLPQQSKLDEAIEFMDLDDFEMTMEEKELELPPAEGEGIHGAEGFKGMYGEGGYPGTDYEMGEEEGYYTTDKYSQYDLDREPSRISEQINTDVTYFPIKKEILYPTYVRGKQQMKYRLQKYKFNDKDWENYLPPCPPDITKSEELRKETNFLDMPDDTQVILGTKNVTHLGRPAEYIAPFVCIMANVVAKKYSLASWTGEIVDYILKCGSELYSASKFRYDQVSKLEIPRITLGNNVYTVLVEYIFDSYIRQNILDLALEKILFVRSDTGVIVTPTYACAVILKNYLYYLYDPFGNNEVGLSEGPGKKGVTCISRFKDLHSLTTRILYNKKKRETGELVYNRFVLSSVKVKEIKDISDSDRERRRRQKHKAVTSDNEGEGQMTEYDNVEEEFYEDEGEEEPPPENKVGYQYKSGYYTITGTKSLPNRKALSTELTEDHFICVCACLILLTLPVNKWDTKKVDLAIDYGMHVFSHADDLLISEKRTIKNILIGKHFFDIIIKMIKIEDWRQNRRLRLGLDYLLGKKLSYFLIQFPNACYVIHKSKDDRFHIFDPYGQPKDKPAGWLRSNNANQMKRQLKKKIVRGAESYTFYTFEVTSITKAPKELVLSHKLQQYDLAAREKKEKQKKPFYEDVEWLKVDPIAWSRKNMRAPNGKMRGTPENLWYNWDEEYPKDLYSLLANINQNSTRFSSKTRGKQTLANLVTAIGMTKIYELEEWNSAVVDSILVNGDNYFIDCTENISDEDYELSMDDLITDCSIFPFNFKVSFTPIIEGTMFLIRHTQYNLYKALWYFFYNCKNRCGIIYATRQERKRQVAFGKLRESEYFMFDSSCRGNPMFLEGTGVAYILRMTTLNRLLHVLTLTLRGGDFYIYEVEVSDLKPLT